MTAELLFFRSATADEVKINKAEALSYLGLHAKASPDGAEELFSLCLDEVKRAADFKAVYTRVPVTLLGNGEVDFGFMTVHSEKLEKNLAFCREAFIFAATAGFGIDRLILRSKRLSPAKSLVADAIGSAAAEGFCNLINAEMKEGRSLSPRFSPGYGGLSLSCQRDILEYLDAQRKVGITLSDAMFMSPSKSVTAIVGIRDGKGRSE